MVFRALGRNVFDSLFVDERVFLLGYRLPSIVYMSSGPLLGRLVTSESGYPPLVACVCRRC
jgi:hypothetical protein